MRDLMYVIAALLIAGWLLGLNFYSVTTSVEIMGMYVSIATMIAIIGLLRKQQQRHNNEEITD